MYQRRSKRRENKRESQIKKMEAAGINFISGHSLNSCFYSFTDNDFEISKNLDIFSTLIKQLNTHYADNINMGELMKTGIDEMLNSLDPYTNYIPESEAEDYKFMTTGQYGGIGASDNQEKGIIL